MKFDLTTPCKDCPFRVDGRTKKADEVASQDQIELHLSDDEYSSGCHLTSCKPETDDQYCMGAYLAKKSRGRMSAVIRDAVASGEFNPKRVANIKTI